MKPIDGHLNLIEQHGTPWSTMELNEIPWNTLKARECQIDTIVAHRSQRKPIEFNGSYV